jgi:hypothetical protein
MQGTSRQAPVIACVRGEREPAVDEAAAESDVRTMQKLRGEHP